MLKIATLKVLEITEEDVKELKRNDSPLMTCGRLEAEADIIICKGRVLKNKHGETFMNSSKTLLAAARRMKVILIDECRKAELDPRERDLNLDYHVTCTLSVGEIRAFVNAVIKATNSLSDGRALTNSGEA